MPETGIKEENLKKLEQIALRLSSTNLAEKENLVQRIIDEIKIEGDNALAKFTEKFDNYKHDLSSASPFKVEIDIKNKANFKNLDSELQESLKLAKARIERFHQEEFKQSNFASGWSFTGDYNEKLGVHYRALDSVAVYIPGGQAPLVSTTLMTAIPAQIAGVKRIVLLSPPPINQAILAAAELLGIEEVYSIGGAQAIAALSYGTKSIKAVNKIVGPGNIYVSIAKKICFGQIGIDGIYGPSELAIIADETANAKEIAADLLSQLEHGSGLESCLLVSNCKNIVEETEKELERQIKELSQKHKTAEQIDTIWNSYKKWSALLHCEDLDEAIAIINEYAPEHLELQIDKTKQEEICNSIKNAGAIFIGSKSCESLGDYLAGPSHCLPTGGSAKFSSGLQSADFLKKTSIIDFSETKNDESFKKLIKDVANIARAESLEAHARAMELRDANN